MTRRIHGHIIYTDSPRWITGMRSECNLTELPSDSWWTSNRYIETLVVENNRYICLDCLRSDKLKRDFCYAYLRVFKCDY